MHPLLVELARRFDHLAARNQILEAIFDLEALCGSLDKIEQETMATLIDELYRRFENIEA